MMKTENTLYIKKLTTNTDGSLTWEIEIDGHKETILMSFSANVASFLTTDRCDAIVMGVLMFAIRHNMDIVSEYPISETLYYKLTRHYIPGICSEHVHRPKIEAEIIPDITERGGIVATGVSCGVDSLYTIMEHSGKDVPIGFRLNHLVFLNAGAHHFGAKEQWGKLYTGRRKNALEFSTSVNLPIIEISTNLPEILEKYSDYDHVEHHTFMMLSCILMVQRGIKRYYYSGGYPYSQFDCELHADCSLACAHFDLFTLWCASGLNMEFFSTGGSLTRAEKVKALKGYTPGENYLNVCVASVHNCGRCFKCKRTLLELDAAGIVDKYYPVFDIESYSRNRKNLILEGYRGAIKGDDLLKELSGFFNSEISPAERLVQRLRVMAGRVVSIFR